MRERYLLKAGLICGIIGASLILITSGIHVISRLFLLASDSDYYWGLFTMVMALAAFVCGVISLIGFINCIKEIRSSNNEFYDMLNDVKLPCVLGFVAYGVSMVSFSSWGLAFGFSGGEVLCVGGILSLAGRKIALKKKEEVVEPYVIHKETPEVFVPQVDRVEIPSDDVLLAIEKLAKLYRNGIITMEEYEQAKRKYLEKH